MSVAGISSASLPGYGAAASSLSASQQALLALQNSLATGNLTTAQTAFNTYQQLNQPASTGTSSTSTSTPFTTDLAALSSAISSGDLTTAQSAFATLQAELKTTPAPTLTAALAAVQQSVQSVTSLLNFSDSNNSSSTTTDPLTSLLLTAYGQNPSSTATDPNVALLESKYGASAFNANGTPVASSSTPAASGNGGSGASVNVYA
jgi:hypothetical protein